MSDEETLFTKEQELRDIYYDPVRGYQLAQKLYEAARVDGLDMTLRLKTTRDICAVSSTD